MLEREWGMGTLKAAEEFSLETEEVTGQGIQVLGVSMGLHV